MGQAAVAARRTDQRWLQIGSEVVHHIPKPYREADQVWWFAIECLVCKLRLLNRCLETEPDEFIVDQLFGSTPTQQPATRGKGSAACVRDNPGH